MNLIFRWSGSLAFGLLAALVGFSYSMATLNNSERENQKIVVNVSPRSVGVTDPLRFTNPFLPAGVDVLYPTGGDQPTDPDVFDLGDACYGSVITRHVNATGGVRPYTFSSDNLSDIVKNSGSSLKLSATGLLVGTVSPAVSSPLSFNVTVADSYGTDPNTRTGIFRINLFQGSLDIFRFAMDTIPGGQLGRSYAAKLETIGGQTPIKFNFVAGSLSINGVNQGASATLLNDLGIAVFEDGTVAGRPLKTGTISFAVQAVDSLGRIAKNRTNTAENQTIAVVMENSDVTSTDLTTFSCIIKGDRNKPGKHSIKYKGLINTYGLTDNFRIANNPLDFRVGEKTFNQTNPFTGQKVAFYDTHSTVKALLGDGTQVNSKLNVRNGQLAVNIGATNVEDAVEASGLSNNQIKRLVLQINIGEIIASSELLDFQVSVSGSKFQLTYSLGKTGKPLAGAFQLISVKGKDQRDLAGREGDAWSLRFLAIPRFDIDWQPGLTSVNSVVVRLGYHFSHTVTASYLNVSGNGGVQYVNKLEKFGVKKIKTDPVKYIHQVQTWPISFRETAVPPAKYSDGGLALPFGFDIYRSGDNTNFIGEGARPISPMASNWTDRVK
jgi:hypothetical protein